MAFFDNFPKIYYTFDTGPNAQFKTVVDIFVRTKFLSSILDNISIFYTYDIKDGDTPEAIAYKLYGDAQRHWMVLYMNQILDPYYEWPLDNNEFANNMVSQFGSTANAQATLHHIEKRTYMISTSNYQQTINTYVSLIGTDVTSIDGFTTLPTIENPVIQLESNTILDFPDGSTVDTSAQLVAVSNYDYSYNLNESNRSIKLVRPEYANQIESELNNLLSQ